MEQNVIEETHPFVSPAEHRYILRLCALLSGEREAAEDLAQETMLEAWRHQDALRDPTRRRAWLAGIARNVCLRWLRKQGQETARRIRPGSDQQTQENLFTQLEETLADDLDIEVELERKELVELLDRALALLPAETRLVLVKHYVEESPLAEVAAQLGANAHAVAMRLQRGKLALRRVLTTSMQQELAAWNLPTSGETWEVTPLWCSFCGQQRLLGKRMSSEGELLLKCPACSPGADEVLSKNQIPALQGVKGYKPLQSRLRLWCHHYYRGGMGSGSIACQQCDHRLPLFIGFFEQLPDWARRGDGTLRCAWQATDRVVGAVCPSCQRSSLISLESLVLALPESRQFLQTFPRIRTLPKEGVEIDGQRALVSRFQSVSNSATLTVISAEDTYEVLRIVRGGW